jgi:hypothetical protein
MNKVLLFFMAIVALSCKEKPQTRQEMILGDWGTVDTTKNSMNHVIYGDTRGFEFLSNGICDYKAGYMDYERFMNDTTSEKVPYFLGTKTKYSITKDSLKIFNLSEKKWDNFKIDKLNKDTLILSTTEKGNRGGLFIKKEYKTDNVPDFDAVIVSSSPCFGACPANDIMITEDGDVFYYGEYHVVHKGIYTSKITKEQFDKIELRFKQANYLQLNDNYSAGHTDGQTVDVSFIKNGKVIKTISDYSRFSPPEFIWAYVPLMYLNQEVKLTPFKIPEYLKYAFSMSVKKQGQVLAFTESESLYLLYLLTKGKECNKNFKEEYELENNNKSVSRITSDGRFYKFYLKDN